MTTTTDRRTENRIDTDSTFTEDMGMALSSAPGITITDRNFTTEPET